MSMITSVVGFPSVAFATPARWRSAVAATPSAKKVGRGLYGVLGMGEAASTGEIKAAYRSLAKRLHPDVAVGGDSGKFLEIQRAYATLSDPEERTRYDLSIGLLRLRICQVERLRKSQRWETDQCW